MSHVISSSKDETSGVVHIRIVVPDISFQTLMVFNCNDTVWTVKQKLLSTITLKDLHDGLNYGLYCLPANGRAGKFLDEERPLREYPFSTPIGVLEFKYKKRVYKTTPPDTLRMKKLHSATNLKAFLDSVQKGDVDKISALTNKGLDPNFIDRNTGETPLTMATTLQRPRSVMLVLVSGGALLDYRNSRSLTAIHVAVLTGNRDALMTLLDLGASPNYKDSRGLTPLYYCVIRDSRAGPQCVQMLLHDRADIEAHDEDGNTELHQGCLNGRVQHVEHLVFYGADLNAQNTRGDTSLHICARYNQANGQQCAINFKAAIIPETEECARVLLFRGADKTIKNNFHEDAYHVANIAGHSNLAEIIRTFPPEDVVLFQELPTYNTKRRGTISAATLRNLQRSRSNPQLNLLFDNSGTSVAAGNGSGSLSSLHQFNSNGYLAKTHRVNQSRPVLDTESPQSAVSQTANQQNVSLSSRDSSSRLVVLQRDHLGFGFILRGAKSRPGQPSILDFSPSRDFPSLQYFDFIEEKSTAARAGLQCGDFLLEVNGTSVINATHEHAVKLIKSAGDTLTLKVIKGKSFQLAGSEQAQQLYNDNVRNVSDTMSSWKQGPSQSGTWSHTSVEGLEALERLDATLDNYDQEYGRYQSQPMTTYGHHDKQTSSNDVTSYVTKAELHHPLHTSPQVLPPEPVQDYLPEPEPDPDYDSDDLPSPPLDIPSVDYVINNDAPTPPPLPISVGIPYQYTLRKTQNGNTRQSNTAVHHDNKQHTDESHAALLAAVQRRRNLLESVDGSTIADSIENRVQRAKMIQQTVYRADQSSPQVRRTVAMSDVTPVSHDINTTNFVDFTAEAERARLEFVKKSATPPSTINNNGKNLSTSTGKRPPPPKPQRTDVPVYKDNTGTASHLSSTPNVTSNQLFKDGNNLTNRLKVETTYDGLSLISSVSTASTSSLLDHDGSPSQSSSVDSGFKSMSASPHGEVDQPIIAPPAEFASNTDVFMSPVATGGLRSVIKQQSNSMVFPARISQK